MHLLLCAATPFEIQATVDVLKEGDWDVNVLITGVGLTAATYALTKAIVSQQPDLVLQAGVAGTLDDALALNQVVVVRNEWIGDLGVEEENQFRSLTDLGLIDKNEWPWTEGRLRNDDPLIEACGLKIADSVSVNEISTKPGRLKCYRELGAQIESMEGAALHYVALKERTRFLQVRAISNLAGERDKKQWKMEGAIAALNGAVQELLNKILKS